MFTAWHSYWPWSWRATLEILSVPDDSTRCRRSTGRGLPETDAMGDTGRWVPQSVGSGSTAAARLCRGPRAGRSAHAVPRLRTGWQAPRAAPRDGQHTVPVPKQVPRGPGAESTESHTGAGGTAGARGVPGLAGPRGVCKDTPLGSGADRPRPHTSPGQEPPLTHSSEAQGARGTSPPEAVRVPGKGPQDGGTELPFGSRCRSSVGSQGHPASRGGQMRKSTSMDTCPRPPD